MRAYLHHQERFTRSRTRPAVHAWALTGDQGGMDVLTRIYHEPRNCAQARERLLDWARATNIQIEEDNERRRGGRLCKTLT